MSGSVSAIIFDIGNVLIEWDMRLLYRKIFNDEAAIDRFITETNLWAWNIEQDRGRSWAEAEHDLIPHYPHYEAEIKAFRARWHDMVSGPISGSVALKAKLHELGVPLYAITNFASDTFREAQERFSFLYEFRDIVVSGAEGLIKPDPAIYQLCLERNDLEANACLFIDDSLNNIKGAQKVGLQTHHFTSPDLLAEDLRRRGFDV
ncbi:MAG: HAD family phosphatase [Cohaesibacter sp.]|nr:HAD family phosphatase [Cohaesibacter sp.]